MKNFARALLKKLKSEPVMLVTFIAIAAQAGQKAIDGGHFTFTLWMTYLFQAVMASIARELVVPGSKHEETKELVSKTIVSLEADFQKRLRERLDHLDGGGK